VSAEASDSVPLQSLHMRGSGWGCLDNQNVNKYELSDFVDFLPGLLLIYHHSFGTTRSFLVDYTTDCMMYAFDLAETFSQFLSNAADLVEDEVDLANYSDTIDGLIDSLTVEPESIAEETVFNAFKRVLHGFADLNDRDRERVLDLLITGIRGFAKEQTDFQISRPIIEHYMFLLHWFLIRVESDLLRNQPVIHTAKKTKTKTSDSFTLAVKFIMSSLEAVCEFLKAFDGAYATTSERDIFAGLYLRPLYLFMENDQLIKQVSIRMNIFKTICLAVKIHHQQSGIKTSLLQLFIYFEHLSEPLAELFQILYEQYDYSGIAEEFLSELSKREFSTNDSKEPKVVSVFLIKLSQLMPSLVMKNMTSVVKMLDCESFTLRSAIIEVTGNIVIDVCRKDDMQLHRTQLDGFLDLIQERSLDINPYCRCKVLQVLSAICE
jgi:condensin complex subunit 1